MVGDYLLQLLMGFSPDPQGRPGQSFRVKHSLDYRIRQNVRRRHIRVAVFGNAETAANGRVKGADSVPRRLLPGAERPRHHCLPKLRRRCGE